MKIWRGQENTDDKIIAYADRTIYKGNPKIDEIDYIIIEMKNGIIPTRNFIAIPLSYIKEIKLQEGKNQIEIMFGKDSYEELKIKNVLLRTEIFDYFKQNISGATYSLDEYSKLRAGKKPLIAMAVIGILFLWSLCYAIGYDNGNEYEISNGHYNSLTGIVLAIASYGVKKVVIVFGLLLSIAFFSFIRKIKSPPIINRIKLR
jgi:hypothetical protein